MREGRPAVILEWAKHRICVDLIPGRRQETAAVITAQVVAKRADRAAVVEECSPGSAGIQHGLADLCCASRPVVDSAALRG